MGNTSMDNLSSFTTSTIINDCNVVTPSFSKDRRNISRHSSEGVVSSMKQALEIVSEWDVIHCNMLKNRLTLESENDWLLLFESCDAISTSVDSSTAYDMEKV